jgi:Na+/H+ antiporter NhaD/arsenite permease-like protein
MLTGSAMTTAIRFALPAQISRRRCISVALLLAAACGDAQAASALPGATMTWPWALPFVGLLLTIATGPLLFRHVWHHHYGKIALGWSLATLAAVALVYGAGAAWQAFVHAIAAEFLSFIVVLFALYTVAGGILITGSRRGTPANNTILLAIGTGLASFVGTTGAAMILIRPLLRANEGRYYRAHTVVFFIWLVANIGGALSPLGDPPLFVGFLRGVDFFWPAQNLLLETVLVAALVLGMFFAIEAVLYRRERREDRTVDSPAPVPMGVRGLVNLVLLVGVIGCILGSALWKPGIAVTVFGTTLELQNLARDAALVLIGLASLWLTPEEHRAANGFRWDPMQEVAILFAAIFVCIIPVLVMLDAGPNGAFASLIRLVSAPDGSPNDFAYFWLTGALSAFLDNAPTYLVFFELAGGDAARLTGPLASTLAAISMGAVYMGALTYIGNAPNFMIYAIATERGIAMPSFITYLGYALLVLGPVFVLVSAMSFW